MHAQLQGSLRAALRGRRDTESIGPFLAAFDADSTSPFRNYAIPNDDAEPTLEQIEGLRRVFQRRERLPRLEFLPAAAPAVEPALLSAGFVTEARLPIMTCTTAQLRQPSPPRGVDVVMVTAREGLCKAAELQNAAYHAPEPTEADIVRLERTVAAGGVVAFARHADGQALGSGLVTAPSEGFAELAAVGVLPVSRRRGGRHADGRARPGGPHHGDADADAHGLRVRAVHLRSSGLYRHLRDHFHLDVRLNNATGAIRGVGTQPRPGGLLNPVPRLGVLDERRQALGKGAVRLRAPRPADRDHSTHEYCVEIAGQNRSRGAQLFSRRGSAAYQGSSG